MEFADNRIAVLKALSAMGVEIPEDTKLATEELVKRLSRAIDYSQLLQETKIKPDINPSKLKKWIVPAGKTLEHYVWRGNATEATELASFRAGGPIPILSLVADAHLQLRVSIAHFCNFYEKGHRVIVCLNSDKTHCIVLRVSDSFILFCIKSTLKSFSLH